MDTNPSLHQQVAEQPTEALRLRLDAVTKQIAAIDQERHALRGTLNQIQEQIQARERSLLFAHSGSAPEADEQLDALRASEQETKQRLRLLPEREEQLREIAYVIRDELAQRAVRLDRLAKTAVKEAWQGNCDERIDVARRAVADAMLAYALQHGGVEMPLLSVEASAFFTVKLNPHQINQMVQDKYAADVQAARKKLIKNNPNL